LFGYYLKNFGGFGVFEVVGFEEVGYATVVVEDKIAEDASIAVCQGLGFGEFDRIIIAF
jgi:hypothetical protein